MDEILRPGLSEGEVRGLLGRAGVEGEIGALVALYTWRNGERPDTGLPAREVAFFPNDIYHFLSLEEALDNFRGNQEAAADLVEITGDPTHLREGMRRYFPIFTDGSTGFLGVDLEPSNRSRVVVIEFESTEPFVEAYPSFAEFIEDAIRANQEDDRLSCFQIG